MDDRAVAILENYQWKVLRTWKGRGTILCETDSGLKILSEYTAPKEKVILQDKVLTSLRELGITNIEELEKTKDDELLIVDADRKQYIVKTYADGKECDIRNIDECYSAMKFLATLHKGLEKISSRFSEGAREFSLIKEYEKHGRELKRARTYLKQKGQKTDFELLLIHNYDLFFNQAQYVCNKIKEKEDESEKAYPTMFCHGDYQYHNILMGKELFCTGFDKYIYDSRVRDVYLFMRKVLEKVQWDRDVGKRLLSCYQQEFPLTEAEMEQLYYRFLYPEKFWKIVNYYYNTRKEWLSVKNTEKLLKLLKNEEEKEKFVDTFHNL